MSLDGFVPVYRCMNENIIYNRMNAKPIPIKPTVEETESEESWRLDVRHYFIYFYRV